jgi:hypothetical protein
MSYPQDLWATRRHIKDAAFPLGIGRHTQRPLRYCGVVHQVAAGLTWRCRCDNEKIVASTVDEIAEPSSVPA